jgi:hypothetical protein
MPLHNDEPTLIDQLNRVALVEEVGEAVATCEPPQIFGIHGDWGLGKTSFLHQLRWYLTGECPQQTEDQLKGAEKPEGIPRGQYKDHVTVVWFKAWRYQHEQIPVVALLQEIRSQLAWYIRLEQQAKKMLEVTIRSALLSLEDLTKKIGIQASKIQEVGDKWERDHLATALPSHTIREHLQEAISNCNCSPGSFGWDQYVLNTAKPPPLGVSLLANPKASREVPTLGTVPTNCERLAPTSIIGYR